MKQLTSLLIFQKKLIIPSLILAYLLNLLLGTVNILLEKVELSSVTGFGFAYLFSTLLFQYFIYEIKNKNEYYFYFNLGISKAVLWAGNFAFGLLVLFITMILL